MDRIKIEGSPVTLAQVDGSPDVFQSPCFVLVKPRWVPDETCSSCDLCHTKFTQLKRRHHCRVCGGVRCAKCCNEKIPLPHLAEEEAERVCESCRTITQLVTMSRSRIDSYLLDSAKGLSSFSKHNTHIRKLLELGGLQTLVALSLTENAKVLGHVVSGLHSLTTHTNLHQFLADAGAIKAICKILRSVEGCSEQTVLDGIGALMIFCKSPELKTKVMIDGGLKPVIHLCSSPDDAVSVLAISALGLIAENADTHGSIFADPENPVLKLLQKSRAFDEQVQEVSLRTLSYLSAGSPEHKHRLLQEDFTSGRQLLEVFNSCPNNQQVMCNAACIIGNLATSKEDQAALQDFLRSTCRKLKNSESNTELLCHLTRTLANFASHKQNASYMLDFVPDIIQCSLKSSASPVQAQSMRLLINLLMHEPAPVASSLTSDGAFLFIKNLATIPNLLSSLQTVLSHQAPEIARPF